MLNICDGIRAAYQACVVLSALQDGRADFVDHVFAISGVSGGSVGASTFAALASRANLPGRLDEKWVVKADKILHRDWPGKWDFKVEMEASLRGLACLEPME